MKKTKMIMTIAFAMCSMIVFGQKHRLEGVVSDAVSGELLPGVTVMVAGTTVGTVTDFDGKYVVQVPDDGSLQVSFIGYKTTIFPVQGKSTLNIKLESELFALDEIVAVGYGVVKKSDVTGSVASVSAEDLTKSPITSLDQGMQGKVAGVTIQQSSGAPGQAMKMRIRGGGSINYDNSPLYVIDGFIGADISSINPSDIATIDILKDASATAVYGSRGANGVVLITTNKPSAGEMVISVDANYSVGNISNEFDLLTPAEQALLMNERADMKGVPQHFTEDEIKYFEENGGTDYTDLVTQSSTKSNVSLNIAGGSDKLSYFFSANNVEDNGIINESFYKRTGIRSNIQAKLTDRIDMTFNTYGTLTKSQSNGQGVDGANSPYGRAVIHPRFWNSKDADGNYIDPADQNAYNGAYQPAQIVNPELFVNEVNQNNESKTITANLDFNIQLAKNLKLTVANSGRTGTSLWGSMDVVDGVNFKEDNISAQQTSSNWDSYINTEILSYDNRFGDHNLKLAAIYEFSKSSSQSMQAKSIPNNTGNDWYLIGNGTNPTNTSSYSETKMRSYMGRFNYGYKDRYLVTASMRADGSSKFNGDNKWGYFPSAALAWRASEEQFIKDMDWIYNFKVRAGFGSTGNSAIGAYGTKQTLSTSDNHRTWYPFNGKEPVNGVIPGSPANANMKWETTVQYNAGVDFAILNGKVSSVIDVYQKQSKDVIIQKSIPTYTGHSSYLDNLAEVVNTGVEISINWDILNKNDWNWSTNFNFSKNVNEITNLDGAESVFIAGEAKLGMYNIDNKFIAKKGESMGALWGLKSVGLWQADQVEEAKQYSSVPGEVRYEDLNNDGAISSDDRQIIGNAMPDFTYGLSTNVSYKNIDLSLQFIGSKGNDIYNYSRYRLDKEVMNADLRDRWSANNQDATQCTMFIGNEYADNSLSSYYVEDGSYFKLANMTLGYTIPEAMTERLGIGSLRVYASGNNLFTITDYSGLDPEGSSTASGSDSQSGIDAFSYPLVRSYAFGLKVVF